MRVAPPTNRPISGRRENLRFPARLLGKSGNRDFGISSEIHGAFSIRGPPSVGAVGQFPEPVFAGNLLRNTRRRHQNARRWTPIDPPLLTSWPDPDFRITPCQQRPAATPADRFRCHANPVTPNAARKGAAGPAGGSRLGGRARKYLGPARLAFYPLPDLLPPAGPATPCRLPPADRFRRRANLLTPNTARQGVAGLAGGGRSGRG